MNAPSSPSNYAFRLFSYQLTALPNPKSDLGNDISTDCPQCHYTFQPAAKIWRPHQDHLADSDLRVLNSRQTTKDAKFSSK
jgi:hypothetical protein